VDHVKSPNVHEDQSRDGRAAPDEQGKEGKRGISPADTASEPDAAMRSAPPADVRESFHTRSRTWAALNWPNRISIFRFLLTLPFVLLLMNQHDWHWGQWYWGRHAALGVFVVMAASDLLDGLLARRLDLRTRLGAILDPLADKTLIICSVLLLAWDRAAVPGHKLPNWVVIAVVGKDLWVIGGFLVVYLVTDRFRIRPTLAGKAATFGQLVMVTGVLLSPDLDKLGAGVPVGSYLVTFTTWAVAALSVLAIISYTRLGLRFVVEEEKPLDQNVRTNETSATQQDS